MMEVLQFLLPPFVACISMVAIFGYIGMHVLKREIIFIDIALAQIAAVGATVALTFFHFVEHSIWSYVIAFAFTILAAAFFSQIDKRITQISHEAIIGVSYAIAAAAALFILAMSAGGDVHMEHMLTGSILWASWSDILICCVIYLIVGLFHFMFRERFISLSENYKSLVKNGMKAVWWDFLFYVSMGLVITFSVKIAGVLVIFSLLIIPATFSAFFAQDWGKRLIIAWAMGIGATLAGLSFSYLFDFSCGPSVVSFLGLALIVGSLLRKSKTQVFKI